MNPNTVINSAEFTGEQKEYLRGFFAGIAQRGLGLTPFVGHTPDGLITSDPASGLSNRAAESEPLWFNTPVSDSPKRALGIRAEPIHNLGKASSVLQ